MRDHLPPPGGPDHRPTLGWFAPGKPDRARRVRSGWEIFGIILAVAAALTGLVVLGLGITVYVGLSHWGSNK